MRKNDSGLFGRKPFWAQTSGRRHLGASKIPLDLPLSFSSQCHHPTATISQYNITKSNGKGNSFYPINSNHKGATCSFFFCESSTALSSPGCTIISPWPARVDVKLVDEVFFSVKYALDGLGSFLTRAHLDIPLYEIDSSSPAMSMGLGPRWWVALALFQPDWSSYPFDQIESPIPTRGLGFFTDGIGSTALALSLSPGRHLLLIKSSDIARWPDVHIFSWKSLNIWGINIISFWPTRVHFSMINLTAFAPIVVHIRPYSGLFSIFLSSFTKSLIKWPAGGLNVFFLSFIIATFI